MLKRERQGTSSIASASHDEQQVSKEEEEEEACSSSNRKKIPCRLVALEKKVINPDLSCPICLRILRDPEVGPCMHRFCNECIHKCLRSGWTSCPTCRVHFSSRRVLRKDQRFEAIIRVLYPNLDESEAEEERYVQEIATNRERLEAFSRSVQEGLSIQKQTRRQQAVPVHNSNNHKSLESVSRESSTDGNSLLLSSKNTTQQQAPLSSLTAISTTSNTAPISKAKPSKEAMKFAASLALYAARTTPTRKSNHQGVEAPASSSSSQLPSASSHHHQQQQQQFALEADRRNIKFILRRHPLEKVLGDVQLYLLSAPRLTISSLQKFCELQLKHSCPSLQISFTSPELQTYVLTDSMTLHDVLQEFCDGNYESRLVLHYRNKTI